jgi:sortase A
VRARRRRAIRKWLSWLLLAGGAFFLISGAREVLLPILGQHEISREWKSAGHIKSQGPVEVPQIPREPDLGNTVCRLLIPRLDTHLFVVEGTDRKDLRIGPGHMEGSAMPGVDGNCIIAGHRDTHFRVLKDLRKGDDIILQTRTGEFHYRVEHLSVVSPRDTKPLQPTSTPVLNLITCYPFYYVGSAPKRFVVEAALIEPQTASAQKPDSPAELSPPVVVARHTTSRVRRTHHRKTSLNARGPKKRNAFARFGGHIFGRHRASERDAS